MNTVRIIKLFQKPIADILIDYYLRIFKDNIPALSLMTRLFIYQRHLEYYSDWIFGITGKDWQSRIRRKLWFHCRDHEIYFPIKVDWYHGIKLNYMMGSDLSSCLYVDGCIEPNEFAFLNSYLKQGMVFLDIGANIGLFSLFAAKKVGSGGQVFAFEPSDREQRLLSQNIRDNNLKNITLLKMAVMDRDSNMKMNIADDRHEGQNTFGKFIYPDVKSKSKEKVKTVRLDSFIKKNQINRVDAIKMDIEGGEYKALAGSKTILRKFKPLLLLEITDRALKYQGGSAGKIINLLGYLGYKIKVFSEGTGKLADYVKGKKLSGNVVALRI